MLHGNLLFASAHRLLDAFSRWDTVSPRISPGTFQRGRGMIVNKRMRFTSLQTALIRAYAEYRRCMREGSDEGEALTALRHLENEFQVSLPSTAPKFLLETLETCRNDLADLVEYANRKPIWTPIAEEDYPHDENQPDEAPRVFWRLSLCDFDEVDECLEDYRQDIERSPCFDWLHDDPAEARAERERRHAHIQERWHRFLRNLTTEELNRHRELARFRRASTKNWDTYWNARLASARRLIGSLTQWLSYLEERFAEIAGISAEDYLQQEREERERRDAERRERFARRDEWLYCPACGSLLPAAGKYQSCFNCGG